MNFELRISKKIIIFAAKLEKKRYGIYVSRRL